MALRKVGNSSRLRRALSGGLEGAADAVTLQALLSGEEEEAFPVQPDAGPGTVPDDPFSVAIDSGVETGLEGGDGEFDMDELLRLILAGFKEQPIRGPQSRGGSGGF